MDGKRIIAGITGIFFGGFGIHKFVLNYTREGLILLGITIAGSILSCLVIGVVFVWIPSVIGFIEGIVYLTKSDEEFHNTYVVGHKSWF